MKKYIGVYDIEQHYGGPEEGGWYYHTFTLISSRIIPRTFHKKRNWRRFIGFQALISLRFDCDEKTSRYGEGRLMFLESFPGQYIA